MITRFLDKNEYMKTYELAAECFGDDTDYFSEVKDNRIAVFEDHEKIISMVQLKRVIATCEDDSILLWYICYVCTEKKERRKGYMDRVMNFVFDALKAEGEKYTFLVPVDPDIYRHLDFNISWEYNRDEKELLYDDEEIGVCYAKSLNGDEFPIPQSLHPCDSLDDIRFVPFDDEAVAKYFDYFQMRPNKSADTVPLDCVAYSDTIQSEVALVDGRCLLMIDNSDESPTGCIPFCSESELLYYFRFQEQYYNEVLHIPFVSLWSDEDGVKFLKEHGVLEGYEIEENTEIFDYLYSGESLRTLSGRNLHKKRNLIRQFERNYDGLWEYRTLSHENGEEIISFLESWHKARKTMDTNISLVSKDLSNSDTLAIDIHGVESILKNRALSEKIRIGGIYINNKMAAFSIGGYNPAEKMAVISFEKALPEITGLYQIINREFLRHEFSFAEIVNREDDIGIPGLRQAKMSYYPIGFSKKYRITQKNAF